MVLTNLMDLFGSKQQTRLIQYMLDNPGKIFNQASLARFLSCSPSTVARVVNPFIFSGIVKFEMIGKQMKVFALDTESSKTKLLTEFYQKLTASESTEEKDRNHDDEYGTKADVI